ncbi:MAG: solute carrier family 23 protein [Parabacteroides sp.]|jgi:uracil permease|uniref:NCS2 family nucleobase:cation symporter n=1 Tax=Parabacteroides faecalis TaxID=2924040 RepID=A0ABT0C2M3_9BACT|nr:solute carrier family 23 protein [Parabacteroides faecalis]MCI7286926.1 NCS2 family nucleobase:cation symporter [Parabacteroides sp.]MDY6256290.1 solute carrier family 23 protein [Bacteroidales bacterium]MCJ2381123.1 NCS2 family nucleobase:cation symporter [Parabacteroides faecalis]MDD6951292.1 solute carrier family 23 protein [Parabacteroides sp.]MDD7563037.1 solute carrier family 23 protein [Parabacteroides sp.]
MNLTDTTLSPIRKGIVGVQFLFVAFGATVLVPLLVGLDPSTALFTAGIGTLIFHLVSKGRVPIFLGSSFAFIAPIIKATELYGLSGTLFGLTGVGLVYFAMSALVKWQGLSVINRIFPPVVIGPVIILIGITLAGTGVQMAEENWVLALISLATAVIVSLKAKGLLKLIPIFCGIGVGYLAALFFYEVDLSSVREAAWFKLPKFVHPTFSWEAFVFMLPVAIAPVIEHIGNIYVVNTVANKDFVKDPGLHRTLLGDGIACMIAGVLGGPPVTTYAEVTGAMSITKVTHPQVIRIAAVTAILFSLVGKISALLKSIPNAVLGGIMLLIFGTIATAGVTNMLQHKVDLTNTRNIIIFSLTLTIGIGGATFSWGELSLSGIGLAAIVGVVLNLILPKDKNA